MSTVSRIRTITRPDGQRRIGIDEKDGWFRVVEEVRKNVDGNLVWTMAYEGGFFDETPETAQMIADEIIKSWDSSS